MLAAWVLVPVVIVAAATGCGLLLERLAGRRMPGALLPVAGLAAIVVVGQLATLSAPTAPLAAPLVLVLAAGGAVVGARGRGRPELWPVAAAVAVLLVFGAPVIASGEPTFAGYIKLDDTATWLAITDRLMEQGRSTDGLPPSTYEAALELSFDNGYPVGAFIPLGVVAAATGLDPAWAFQPYVATLAAMVALGISAAVAPLVRAPAARAAVAFVSAQPALLLGYALWGGVKEVAAAALVPLVAVLAVRLVLEAGAARTPSGPGTGRLLRAAIPLAFAAAAIVAVLSAGGAAWLAPLLALPGAGLVRWIGPRAAARWAAGAAAIAAALIVPALALGGVVPPWSSSLTSDGSLGNLLRPLNPLQVVGIWPSGDFRLHPELPLVTAAMIAAAIAAALAGVALAARARAWSMVLYVAGAFVACAAIVAVGSPWVDAKALAIASPAIVAAAMAAGTIAVRMGGVRAAAGSVVLASVVAGVLWSNALAYREVTLAPRDQLAELERIGGWIAGQGPTLMTEYQPYGARHFLRDAAPEGVSELRRRRVPLRDGSIVQPGRAADLDELDPDAVHAYRTLVVRRSPVASRPPVSYRLAFRGKHYDVWQRDPDGGPGVHRHLPLGRGTDPLGSRRCAAVRRAAREARGVGPLAAARRPPPIVVPLAETERPADWAAAGRGPNRVLPRHGGELRARVRVADPGRYGIWLGGSVRSRLELLVDGVVRGSARHRLGNSGEYMRLGAVRLRRGEHRLALKLAAPDLHPGSGGQPLPLGPLVLSRAEARDSAVRTVPPRHAGRLCGRSWDWIEILERPRPGARG